MSPVGGRLGHLWPCGGSKKEGEVGLCSPSLGALWPACLGPCPRLPPCAPERASEVSSPSPTWLPHSQVFFLFPDAPPTPRAFHPNAHRLPLPLATFSFASASAFWSPVMSGLWVCISGAPLPFLALSLHLCSPHLCLPPPVAHLSWKRCLSVSGGSLSPISVSLSLSSLRGSLSLSVISLLLSVSLLLSLPLPPHILSCLWGTGNLGDRRDTGRLSYCRLEIMRGGGGAEAGWGWGIPASPASSSCPLCAAHRDRGIMSPLWASVLPSVG